MISLVTCTVLAFCAALWLGKLLGYREGVRDGHEMALEAIGAGSDIDDGGPDGGETVQPVAELKLVRDKESA